MTGSSQRIRRAGAADVPDIVRIINAAFVVEREFRPGERTSIAEIGALLGRDPFLVAEGPDGHVTGAVQVRVTGDIGYFGMLSVDPAIQGGGIGRALLEASEQLCRDAGCSKMTLSTGEDRNDVITWYARRGYRLTSTESSTSNAFSRPIRVVHMEKPL